MISAKIGMADTASEANAIKYDELAAVLKEKVGRLTNAKQFWIGLAGAPGSGKTTLAEALKERLGKHLAVIPLDGFHYSRKELFAMSDPKEAFARRGAPFTFNASRFVNVLIKAHSEGKGVFPSFDHGEGDPVEGSIELKKIPQIVLVEGNYLLLNQEPWAQLHLQVFDEKWFLDVPIAESNRRVLERHIKTGLTREEAQFRVEYNDSKNAALVTAQSPSNADRIIRLM